MHVQYGKFSPYDKHKQKTGCCWFSDSLVVNIFMWKGGIAYFVTYISVFYSDNQKVVAYRNSDIQIVLQLVKKYFTISLYVSLWVPGPTQLIVRWIQKWIQWCQWFQKGRLRSTLWYIIEQIKATRIKPLHYTDYI